MKRTSALALILSLFALIQAQVVINEYSAANYSDVDFQTGPGSAYEDWIELYNTSGAPVDLTGYYLSDKLNNIQKWQFPAGASIPGNGHLLLLASGENAFMNGYQNTNFKLTQTHGNEYVILSNTTGVIIDSIRLNYSNKTNHSRGRLTDGSAQWGVFDNPTEGGTNTNAFAKYADKATFNVAPGAYAGAQTIVLSTTEPNSVIRYTTDGSKPNGASTQYITSLNVAATTVIRAKTYSTDPLVLSAHTETNSYFINENHTVKIISVCGNNLATLFGGTQNEPEGSFELFETDGTFLTEATGEFNKHGNDSWVYNQRGVDFIARDQFGINHALEDEIFDTKNRDEFQRVILKCGASDNFPFEPGGAHIRDSYINEMSQLGDLRLDERSNEFAVLYLNGNYWGVYDIREKTDDSDFTDYYYDQDVPNIQYLKTWGGTWEEYGAPNAQNDWDAFVSFVDNNNMTVPANYAYVDSVYNTGSLIDYFILNGFVVCADWLNWNTGWWRGLDPAGDKKKWRYTLWDMDASFGHYINYTGVPSQSANADPCDPESLGDPGGQGHVPIWNKLQTNDDFFADYINRYAELSSTVFTCDSMHDLLNTMVAEIQPEMQRHSTRWGGNYNTWLSNVQDIHTFIDTRCVNVPAALVNCNPEISGPYELILNVDPPLSGEIEMTSLTPNIYPFTGTYFGGVNIDLDADAFTGWAFDYWTIENDTILPDTLTENIFFDLSGNDSIVAHFKPDVIIPQDTITFIVLGAGSGTVTINGTAQNTFPFTDYFNDGSLLTLSANANAGFTFSNWSMTNNVASPNNTSASIAITLGSNDTIYAYFDAVLVDTLVFVVNPVGAGNVSINGMVQTVFPFTGIYNDGSLMNLGATPNGGFTFNSWSLSNHAAAPNNLASNINFTLGSNDTVFANFDIIPPIVQDTIVYMVDPIGSGSINLNSAPIAPLPFTSINPTGSNMDIQANANANFIFSFWESTNNAIANVNNSSSSFTSNFNDTLTAHFATNIVDTLVVMTIPNGSATLNVGGVAINSSPFVGVFPVNANLNVEAILNGSNTFNRWSLNTQVLPDYNQITSFVFINQDTLFAFINAPTFVNDLGEDVEEFSLFPTVNDGNFVIDYTLNENTDLNLSIINIEGKVIKSWNYSQEVSGINYMKELSFEGSDGLYFLKISTDKTNATEKLIKISK
jgi:hypothetical protein